MGTARASDGTQLAYTTQGSGKRAVVMVHGWMMSGRVWDDLLEAFAPDDVKVIIPDLRGSGASDKPESGFGIEQLAADVLAVTKAEGVEQFVVVGHSMGGQIAQLLAANAPDKVQGAVLLCPVPASGFPLPPEAYALFRDSAGDENSQGTILDMACKQLTPAARERLLGYAATVSTPCIQQSLEAWTKGGFDAAYAKIKCPTVVIATDDPFLTPEILRGAITQHVKRSRLAYLPGPGHYVLVESPRETAGLLQSFLAGLGVGDT